MYDSSGMNTELLLCTIKLYFCILLEKERKTEEIWSNVKAICCFYRVVVDLLFDFAQSSLFSQWSSLNNFTYSFVLARQNLLDWGGLQWKAMSRKGQFLFIGCGSSSRMCAFELLPEGGGLEFWPCMLRLASPSTTELDHSRACHTHLW